MATLTVTVITKNAERKLNDCLSAAAAIADEIIVIDSGSTDNTVAIAKQFTKYVYSMDWPGFGVQKQRAVDKATSEWILSIDADEVMTPELCQHIKATLKQPKYNGYEIKRYWVLGGKTIRYCDSNQMILRLFKKDQGRFTPDTVHERIELKGPVGRINGSLLHYSVVDMHDWISKLNLYTTLTADDRYRRHKKSSLLKACASGCLSFIKFYFIKRGFLDGRMGFIVAVNWAVGSYYKHVKLAFHDDFHPNDKL